VILVTVGAQMPFNRMVGAVDDWALSRSRDDVLAQIGTTDWRPKHIRWVEFFEPEEFRRQVSEATVLVGHAGMGSILTALQFGKPILVMPRRGDLRETRNDHQVATAERFAALGKIAVARDETEIAEQMDRLSELRSTQKIGPHASEQLIGAIRAFINQESP
jgi:UDP-N-acetylglucosamine transferase subunit ALG13